MAERQENTKSKDVEARGGQAPVLYLLTNDDPIALLLQKLEAAFATDVVGLLQIRRKGVLAQDEGRAQLLTEAKQIQALARQYDVPVLMNDDLDMAEQLGMGVHLGQGDGSVAEARQRLGDGVVIGRTCHDDVALVTAANQEGASYAAMGAVFASTTKPNAETLSVAQLVAANDVPIDLCVIGGLSAENVGELAGVRIRYVAVVGDVMSLEVAQVAERCLQWRQALSGLSNNV